MDLRSTMTNKQKKGKSQPKSGEATLIKDTNMENKEGQPEVTQGVFVNSQQLDSLTAKIDNYGSILCKMSDKVDSMSDNINELKQSATSQGEDIANLSNDLKQYASHLKQIQKELDQVKLELCKEKKRNEA